MVAQTMPQTQPVVAHPWYRYGPQEVLSHGSRHDQPRDGIDAPPAAVWAIVTEARHLAAWFSDEVEIDLRPGGAMLLTWHGHGTYRARVETVEPPHTFAFRWLRHEGNEPVEGASTLVEITLIPEGAGTRLRVVESGFSDLPWPDHERARYADENAKGWIVELDELRSYAALATGAPGER